jgi:FkbM family methyltransferase
MFPKKLGKKLIAITMNYWYKLGSRLGLLGAKKVGVSSNGNALLKLNRKYALGRKGTVLELPEDEVIYKYVKKYGCWELDESIFLARGLKSACANLNSNLALLDIGANTGLVTLQAMNIANTSNSVYVFEPIPRHVNAIKKNLFNLSKVNINEFALGDKNGNAIIFTEEANHGNSSLLKSVLPGTDVFSTEIKLVETTKYFNDHLNNFDKYVIKCDAQGMDAVISSRIPERIWNNCEAAIIEVWALPEISEDDVRNLIAMLKDFKYMGWSPYINIENMIGFSEVGEFWLSKKGSFKNLYLSKNL